MSSNPARAAHFTPSPELQLFSTCPSSLLTPSGYRERVIEAAQWSERAGCTGILVYTDNSLVDPWLVAQLIVANTSKLSPLVAVQPVYLHPYSAAKMASSLAFLYGRRIFFNMVAGGFKNDLIALNDSTPHDRRYERLIEYTRIIRDLLEARGPVTFDGSFYHVTNLKLSPAIAPELLPGFLVSGSSEAGLAAAREMGATAVKYPEPPDRCAPQSPGEIACGVRIGVIARPEEEEAWAVAFDRFPEDRKGQLTRQLATKVSDSAWHKRLHELGERPGAYWLHPFENYQTNCPYLVGSYEVVADELARYMASGFWTYILDIPASEDEFEHTRAVFEAATRRIAA
jgi:alkanesulfonate monooxygenase